MKTIKTLTNIHTVGELKKFLRGIPDDIIIETMDGESCWTCGIGMEYRPHLRSFMVREEFDLECSGWEKLDNTDIVVE